MTNICWGRLLWRICLAGQPLSAAHAFLSRAAIPPLELGNIEILNAAMTAPVATYSLRGEVLSEVAAGAVIKHSRDWNLTREPALSSGLDPRTPAHDVQHACGTSLITLIQLARRIALGEIDCGLAGGADTTSDVPVVYARRLQQIALKSARQRIR